MTGWRALGLRVVGTAYRAVLGCDGCSGTLLLGGIDK